jgi:AcrR family transcriptional regulator
MGKKEVTATSKLQSHDRKREILKGAASAFRQHGYEATSMARISDAAQVSKVLIYRHFVSKKDIYEAILKDFSVRLDNTITIDAELGFNDRLGALIQTASRHPDAFILMFHHAPREPMFTHYAADLQTKRELAIARKLTPLVMDANERRLYVRLLDKMVLGALIAWVEEGAPYPEKIQRIIFNILDAAIASIKK